MGSVQGRPWQANAAGATPTATISAANRAIHPTSNRPSRMSMINPTSVVSSAAAGLVNAPVTTRSSWARDAVEAMPLAGQGLDEGVGGGDDRPADGGGEVRRDQADDQAGGEVGGAVAGLDGVPGHHHDPGDHDRDDEGGVHHRQRPRGDGGDLRQAGDVGQVEQGGGQQRPDRVQRVGDEGGQPRGGLVEHPADHQMPRIFFSTVRITGARIARPYPIPAERRAPLARSTSPGLPSAAM